MKTRLIILLALFCYGIIYAQGPIDENLPQETSVTSTNIVEDQKKIRVFLETVSLQPTDSIHVHRTANEWVILAAKYLLHIPYTEKTLEIGEEEDLVVNLREMDCMTFIENCLALSRAVQYPYPDYLYFIRQLKQIRYREGIIQGYTSRLHYTSDWITDNVNKRIIEDLTFAIGGIKFYPKVSFMSSHPELYPALKNNPQNTAIMLDIEHTINTRSNYYYIPKHKIKEKEHMIKDGDIICFTTQIPGLDISHLGIAYRDKGQLSFIHASSKYKKVIINPESLQDYCIKMKNTTGIIVLRSVAISGK